jgi:perosamine synthetase
MPTIVFAADAGFSLQRAIRSFRAESIDARVFFAPLSSLPMFSSLDAHPMRPHAYSVPRRSLNLPSFHEINGSQISQVISVLEGSQVDLKR